MVVKTSDFESLINEVRAGSQEAAWQIVEEFSPYIFRTIRRSLDREIRAKFDSQDFVQAVWASFFDNSKNLMDVECSDQLIALLSTMARNKMVDEYRKRITTHKYTLKRERKYNRVSDSTMQSGRKPVQSHDPSPSEVAVFREQWHRLTAGQSPQERRIVQLRFEGATYQSIADELNIALRTVQRVIGRIRKLGSE